MSPAATDLFNLTGRVAVITGGSRGLGREMSLAFAQQGANVVVASRKLDQCEAVVAEIAELGGPAALAVEAHVGNWDRCEELMDIATSQFGKIDILVNNAGMSPLYESLSSVSEALFDKVFDVNLKGPFRLSALVAEQMAAGEGGSIINVSSVAAVRPSENEVPYAMAKAGLNTLTIALSQMFGPTVRANGIMPGPFLTDISKAWDIEGFNRRAKTSIPLQRGGNPDEIVGAALYLASRASSYTTGSIIKIDGGAVWSPA